MDILEHLVPGKDVPAMAELDSTQKMSGLEGTNFGL
jgi:hypothetical protein